jgi:hypothetical protein
MLADSVNISLVTADRTPSPCFVLLRIGCIGPHCGQEKRELTGWGVTCQTGRNQEREGETEATLEKMQDEGNEGNHSALSYFPADAAL